jgi:hypothetical protein
MRFVPRNSSKLFVFLGVAACCFAAPLQAQIRTTTHHIEASRKGIYSVEATYPVFRSSSSLARLANRTVSAWSHKYLESFKQQAIRDHKKYKEDQEYTHVVSTAFARPLSPRLLSVGMELYQFSGGAHGMTSRHNFNFGLVDGRPTPLTLGHFFRPGSNYQKRVSDVVIAKLKKYPNADWVQDGTVKALTGQQFNAFGVERDGLRYYFDPYEMGSYASGPFQIKLTLADLGPDFKREWLAR